MLASILLSTKSSIIFLILSIVIGIVSFLYLTLDPDFENEPRILRNFKTVPTDEDKKTNIEGIINLARQTWSLIDQNRAMTDIQASYGSALPDKVDGIFTVEHWKSPPASHSYSINIFNRLKQRVLHFTYSLQYTYGGSLNGKGCYLDRVTIVPSRISVSWAFVFNASVQITSVYNIGSIDDPVAAIELMLHYRLSGLNAVERTESFQVTGHGTHSHINA